MVISDLDPDDGWVITGVRLTSSNGAVVSGTSFTDNSITVDITDFTSPPPFQSFTFNITTSSSTLSAVPVPAGLPLLVTSFGVFAFARRTKRKS